MFNLPYAVFYDDMKTMLKGKKPDAVLGYNAVGNHVEIVEVCAPLGIPVMVEKPLAATLGAGKQDAGTCQSISYQSIDQL